MWSFHVRYSYLSILSDHNTVIFAASSLTLYFRFSSLILSSVVMIILYIFCKQLRLSRKGLSAAKVVSITKKQYGFAGHVL